MKNAQLFVYTLGCYDNGFPRKGAGIPSIHGFWQFLLKLVGGLT